MVDGDTSVRVPLFLNEPHSAAGQGRCHAGDSAAPFGFK
jgi:hypothetical protein